jgi:RimJ/RimL family protein N-acetyltransferase
MDLRSALGTAGEIGYWAHPDARGRGVMSQAVRLAVRHAFIPRADGGLGRRRLRLNAADGNTASQHIARANGFVQVGRDRQGEPLGDGTFADLVRFDLLVDQWPVRE